MSNGRSALLALSLAALGCRTSSSPAPTAAESGAYLVTLGNDTIAAEQYTRVGDRIEGRFVQRTPRTIVTNYVLTLGPSGSPSLLEISQRLPDGTLVPGGARSATVTFTGDSAITQIQRDTLITMRVSARGAHFFANTVVSLYALPIAALRAMNRDSATFVTYSAGSRQAGSLPVARKGPNRYWVYVFGAPQEVVVDDRGRVISADASRSTFRILSQRQTAVDVPSLVTAWAERERATRAMGTLSARDTVNATVGAAQLWVDYGRPLTRGRDVFGPNGVLGDTIWRTGANQATQFRTSVPLTIAGQTVPAGTYTLWTVAVPGRYQLIINKQTGQWGTMYDRAQDLVRVPLQATELPQSVERFTFVIEPTGSNAGVLRLRWDTTELSVPFTTP